MTSTQGPINEEVTAALEIELRDTTQANELHIVGDVQHLTGGFDTDTYAFKLDVRHGAPSDNLVLRHYRESSGPDRPKVESTVQNVSAATGHPVPAVTYDTTGRSLLGRGYT
jgi:hypothetical protein